MFRLNLKIALRNLWKQKGYAAINIFGLSTGLCAFFLILCYVADELSYDRFHQNADRVVRVVQRASWDGGSINVALTSPPFAPALKQDYSEIQEAVRIVPEGGGVFSNGQKDIKAGDVFFTDSAFFKVFSYKFLYGDQQKALAVENSIVLTESLAVKLYGSAADAIGKPLQIDKKILNTVTGVIEDVPENSHLRFSALRANAANFTDGWQNFYVYTYLLLAPNADYKKLEARLPDFYKKHLKPEMGVEDYQLTLQPLTSIHLHSNLGYEVSPNGSIKNIAIFIAAALLILVIAVINYMNLATARATVRAREVGVRKVIGAERFQIMLSFWLESVLLTFAACLLAALLAELLMPYFNQLAGKSLSVLRYGLPYSILFVSMFAIATGTLSGSYPAFYLSGFAVISALKGKTGSKSGHGLLRKSLVIFQFIVTVTMVIVSWVIYSQMQYVVKSDLGFDKDQVLTFHIQDEQVRGKVKSLKQELLQNPAIKKAGIAGNPIGNNNLGSSGYFFETAKGFTNSNIAQQLMIDEDFLPTMGTGIVQGRNFSSLNPSDREKSALINETMMRELGYRNPIGKRVRSAGTGEERTIIGVVKDFHTYSLQHKLQGMLLVMPFKTEDQDNLYVKIDPSQAKAALDWITTVYARFDKANKPEFRFLDENFAAQYQSEARQQKLLLIFTVLAISIALLGLYGLSTFITSQRTKEIAVRRVLGSSTWGIVRLLNSSFLKIAIASSIISWPLAYILCNKWLQDFAYHIQLPLLPFLFSSLFCLLIVLATVSYRTLKAAKANPVDALKYE